MVRGHKNGHSLLGWIGRAHSQRDERAKPGLRVGDVVTIATNAWRDYIPCMRFERIWVEQCRATRAIKRRFGAKSALDYLIGEKLTMFADAARDDPAFAQELPRFLAAVWRLFNADEIAGYVASLRPASRNRLRQLLYLR